MTYELKLEQYAGPLDKLLELIEEKKLEITRINLAAVTEDFLSYLSRVQKEIPAALGNLGQIETLLQFIIIGSRLILIKSKSLLPLLEFSPEEEVEVSDLEWRLAFHKEIRPAARNLGSLWKNSARGYSRPYFQELSAHILGARMSKFVFYPGRLNSPQILRGEIEKILEALSEIEHETEVIREKIRSIEEEMTNVMGSLGAGGGAKFSEMSVSRSRSEIIVLFLAILHLARDQAVRLTQTGRFSDIMVSRQNGADSQ